ncbi:MAG: hypothetical protein QE278_06320 [Limnobacter sp.]|nr:hypothetical protein [Limnobacter sp.]
MNFFQSKSDSQFLSRQLQQIASACLLGGFTMAFLWSIDICAQMIHGQTDNRLMVTVLFSVYGVGCAVYLGNLALIVFEEHRKRVIRDIKQNWAAQITQSHQKPGVLIRPDFKSANRSLPATAPAKHKSQIKVTLAA